MTYIWLEGEMLFYKRVVMFDIIGKHLSLHTEVKENDKIISELIQDSAGYLHRHHTTRAI